MVPEASPDLHRWRRAGAHVGRPELQACSHNREGNAVPERRVGNADDSDVGECPHRPREDPKGICRNQHPVSGGNGAAGDQKPHCQPKRGRRGGPHHGGHDHRGSARALPGLLKGGEAMGRCLKAAPAAGEPLPLRLAAGWFSPHFLYRKWRSSAEGAANLCCEACQRRMAAV
eukprot:CAMPEP_0206431666 /NCGR_PEP_ID=MMETSP0324_2-20121206/7490_1 /ASSEMBLY_ACC=CAM_ASM_000836 /TAXON_ID=2866 /ORGANISM="Crypthecodinium cohnii, Strain Seligo" /LENGTH=172 /DNA_ID=CAMNT_0053897617 /DNA_START=37 /DNA_END=556 /DNA_ORIENTATION=-